VHNKYISYAETGLEDILHECGCCKELDVLFFDIDGGEYQLFRGLISFRPKIVCIEYDNSFPLSINYVPRMIRHHQNGGQASSTAFFHLFRQKRYTYIRSFFKIIFSYPMNILLTLAVLPVLESIHLAEMHLLTMHQITYILIRRYWLISQTTMPKMELNFTLQR